MEDDLQTLADSGTVSIHRGFPNPALDHAAQGRHLSLDLNQLLIRYPSRTYLFRVVGHEWEEQGIFEGDIAIIERGHHPQAHHLILGWQPSGFVICRGKHAQQLNLIWGTVVSIIHDFRPHHD